ncbi:MAG: hypothetical protein C0518_15600 [Opitutus sp.]|nr:hypothetical protein [Opitutus sp.]
MRSAYSRVRSFVAAVLRPPADEVDAYARMIAEHEGCSPESIRAEAELQLWVWHAENAQAAPAHPPDRRRFPMARLA